MQSDVCPCSDQHHTPHFRDDAKPHPPANLDEEMDVFLPVVIRASTALLSLLPSGHGVTAVTGCILLSEIRREGDRSIDRACGRGHRRGHRRFAVFILCSIII